MTYKERVICRGLFRILCIIVIHTLFHHTHTYTLDPVNLFQYIIIHPSLFRDFHFKKIFNIICRVIAIMNNSCN